jgi:hypothetical protein
MRVNSGLSHYLRTITTMLLDHNRLDSKYISANDIVQVFRTLCGTSPEFHLGSLHGIRCTPDLASAGMPPSI